MEIDDWWRVTPLKFRFYIIRSMKMSRRPKTPSRLLRKSRYFSEGNNNETWGEPNITDRQCSECTTVKEHWSIQRCCQPLLIIKQTGWITDDIITFTISKSWKLYDQWWQLTSRASPPPSLLQFQNFENCLINDDNWPFPLAINFYEIWTQLVCRHICE